MKRYLLALFLAAGLLAGCGGDAGPANAPKLEMRVYDVPPDQTETLSRTLNSVFASDEKTALGKASSPAPGRLVVLAPASLHGSIEASLRALAKEQAVRENPAPAKVDGPLRLSFWSVDAVPENGADDPALVALMPALDEARKQMGIVHFELRDHVSGVSSLGENVERSWTGSGTQRAAAAPIRQLTYMLKSGSPNLMLNLDFKEQVPVVQTMNGITNVNYVATGANTTTAVLPGQTLVVTQNPVPDSDGTASVPVTRLYLVRVDAVTTP
jgi:hypothetical protein